MRGVSLQDRIVSALAYFTCGIMSLIWIVYANFTRKQITPFLSFNLYQAIFLSLALTVISLVYSIAVNILAVIPVIGKMAQWFDIFFNGTPVYFGTTISGCIVIVLLFYLILVSLMGRRPYLPLITDVMHSNFGG